MSQASSWPAYNTDYNSQNYVQMI